MRRALVSADRPVVRIWHPDDPKLYVEIQFESQEAANTAVEQLNGMLKYATGMSFRDEWVDLFTLPGPMWRARTRSTASGHLLRSRPRPPQQGNARTLQL